MEKKENTKCLDSLVEMQESTSSTPYDDVFRTLYTKARQLVLPVFNELFGTKYLGDEKVTLLQNEVFPLEPRNGKMTRVKRISDSHFEVISHDGDAKAFHLECQSTRDSSMGLRVFEYAVSIAMTNAVLQGSVSEINFPKSAVIYLCSTSSRLKSYEFRMNFSDTDSTVWTIPVMKATEYSVDEIFQKKLYFILPFRLFVFRDSLEELDHDAEGRRKISGEYQDICNRLLKLVEEGAMPLATAQLLIEMCLNVVRAMTNWKFLNVRKEVESIMGGKVLETIGEKMFLKGGQVANEKTVVRMLMRFSKLRTQPRQQDILRISEDADVSVERVLEIAKENGIVLA